MDRGASIGVSTPGAARQPAADRRSGGFGLYQRVTGAVGVEAPQHCPIQGARPGYFAANGGGPTISIPPFSFADCWIRAMSTGAAARMSSVAVTLAPR